MGARLCVGNNHETAEKEEHLRHLLAANWPRSVQMNARRCPLNGEKVKLKKGEKILYFVRHGQGFHNKAAAESKFKCDCGSENTGNCPYLDEKLVDPHLTEVGKMQMEPLSKITEKLHSQPEIVFVSPLARAIQTALFGFSSLVEDDGQTKIPFIADRNARETAGLHMCDKRRSLKDIKAEFPFVDFSNIQDEQDKLWTPEREAPKSLILRAYLFMLGIRQRKEDIIGVVSHSGWLLTLFNCVMSTKDPSLKEWFQTAELRAVIVSWDAKNERQIEKKDD
mmetsp:Transcript_10099/g.16321  ORF Transcript_10099/g.16321 Transcript_10099/m.16321 type:complete len:280 (+) Transcript_10099:107-946(+)